MRSRYAILASALTLVAIQTHAQTKTAADQELENRVRAFAEQQQTQKPAIDWNKRAELLARMPKSKQPTYALSTCIESKWVEFGERYAITFDTAAQKPCKIYDLSFPTLATMTGFHTVSKIPVQSFTSDDYLNWLDGKYQNVYQGIKNFQSTFKASQPTPETTAGWVSKLKFKSNSVHTLKFMSGPGVQGLPRTFRASDLELGGKFAFESYEHDMLKRVLGNTQGKTSSMLSAAPASPWSETVDNPSGLLEKIKFIWNDAEKVYDVAIEGDFFPLAGPVALVDFNTPYKPAMEALVRSIVESAIMRLVNSVVAEPVTQRIVTVALNDSFEFIEGMYTYQMNLMEPSLRAGAAGGLSVDVDAQLFERGVDLLFSTRSGFFTDYVMAIAQGQEFDWSQIEKIGHKNRYAAEKAREISMNKRNSQLVLDSGCQTEIVHNYFAVCTKEGANQGTYSLLSEYSVLFWGFGAPLVHRPAFKSEVVLKRATSRLLSSGLRMARLPIIGYVTDALADQLKMYAMTGMDDEAFLRADLMTEKKAKGSLDADSAEMLKWLYIQNINPFLPKTESSDDSVISANKAQLTVLSQGR